MLYKFKSKAAGDLIMLEPNGRRVLEIIGKDAQPKGIILPEQMPAAVAALEAAIDQEEADQKALVEEAKAKGEPPPDFEAVSLRQRAVPFLDMLRRCEKAARKSSGAFEPSLRTGFTAVLRARAAPPRPAGESAADQSTFAPEAFTT